MSRARGGGAHSPLRRAVSLGGGPTSPVKASQFSSPSSSSTASPSAAAEPSLCDSSEPITLTGVLHMSSPIWGTGVYTGELFFLSSLSPPQTTSTTTTTTDTITTHSLWSASTPFPTICAGQLRNGVAHGRGSWKVLACSCPAHTPLHHGTLPNIHLRHQHARRA
jgi:hypothetical protein